MHHWWLIYLLARLCCKVGGESVTAVHWIDNPASRAV